MLHVSWFFSTRARAFARDKPGRKAVQALHVQPKRIEQRGRLKGQQCAGVLAAATALERTKRRIQNFVQEETMDEKIRRLKNENKALVDSLRALKEERNDGTLKDLSETLTEFTAGQIMPRVRRTLRGHIGRCVSGSWGSDSRLFASVDDCGVLLLWDVFHAHKRQLINVPDDPFPRSCSISPSGRFVATGGLNGNCYVFLVAKETENAEQHAGRERGRAAGRDRKHDRPIRILECDSHISKCKFISDARVMSSCSDGSRAMWDVEASAIVATYRSDFEVLSFDTFGENLLANNSMELVELWDLRANKHVHKFDGHEADINDIRFFPNGNAVASASDDATCRLFDLRAQREIQCFTNDRLLSDATSLDFSLSGRFMFTGYGEYTVCTWDTMHGTLINQVNMFEDRVTSVATSPDGMCFAATSWDGFVRIIS
jgi:WD40 repeat protein